MKKINNILLKIYEKDYFPFVVLVFFAILSHLLINTELGDVIHHRAVIKESGLFETYKLTIRTWSSRFIVDFIMYLFAVLPIIIWKVMNISMILLFAVTTSKLFVPKDYRRSNHYIMLFFIAAYPFQHMNSAGWVATTITYLWTLSLGMVSLLPIKRIFNGEEICWYEGVIVLICTMYATDHEQSKCILLIAYFVFFIYFLMKRKFSSLLITQTLVSIVKIYITIVHPGNISRKAAEIRTFFPDYNMLSLIQKLKLGLSSTIMSFISTPNLVLIMLCGLVFVCIFIKHKDNFYRLIAAVPFFISCFSLFSYFLIKIFPRLENILFYTSINYTEISLINYKSYLSYVPIIISVLLIGFICLSIYLIFGNTEKSILVNLIFLCGIASRMIMSFSPTLYGSGGRTYIYMYASLIICGIYIYNEFRGSVSEKVNENFIKVCISISFFAFLNNVL